MLPRKCRDDGASDGFRHTLPIFRMLRRAQATAPRYADAPIIFAADEAAADELPLLRYSFRYDAAADSASRCRRRCQRFRQRLRMRYAAEYHCDADSDAFRQLPDDMLLPRRC
jgi:hypothetical protein